ncbi:hypothetical protein G6F37_003905 [Rhizopus arrhizus]|nr:hypothetical protein G6F38_004028 [Rhizopus arrhizus]KAG1160523.1 hypothetical protein G6F37_003905 [Rhizopus arrhizus]
MVNDFNNAVKEIGDKNLRSSSADKEAMKWTRALKKSKVNLFNSAEIYSHFYSIRRHNLLQAKKLLRIQEEAFINDQLEGLDSTEDPHTREEEWHSTPGTNEAREETVELVPNDIVADCLAQSPEVENINRNMLRDLKLSFERSFTLMKEEDKWHLSTGKCVEDKLYAFGMQCVEEHPSHSLIVDVSDKNLVKYKVFSKNEIEEIKTFSKKEMPRMPLTLRDYLNSFNKTTADDIRHEIY